MDFSDTQWPPADTSLPASGLLPIPSPDLFHTNIPDPNPVASSSQPIPYPFIYANIPSVYPAPSLYSQPPPIPSQMPPSRIRFATPFTSIGPAIVNTPNSASDLRAPASKRASTSKTSTRASKRRRKTTTSSAPHHVAATCGVGPSPPMPTSGSSSAHGGDNPHPRRQPLRPSRPCMHTSNTADDVWYFLRALETRDPPPTMPPPDSEPPLRTNPCSPFVGCKLCSNNGEWKTWRHTYGMTTCYRTHLVQAHGPEYSRTIKAQHLKHADDDLHHSEDSPSAAPSGQVPFTFEHFIHLVMRWIVADDQSMNVLDCREFRDVLAYLGADKITGEDIPHRTKITIDILVEFGAEQQRLREEMQHAVGRVSFTSDIWSDPNLDGYMGVTAHYIVRNTGDNRLEWKSHLIAFQIIEGDHSGANIASHFLSILDKYGIDQKIGQITLDNASNNSTFLEELEMLLADRKIPFDHDGNRIRCFPHIVNLACDAILNSIKNDAIPTDPSRTPIPNDQHEYATMLEGDLVGHCRKVVAACRASGKRRHRLREIIHVGNSSGYWKGKIIGAREKSELPEVQLLRDCETRWSSTFLMLRRILALYPAVASFLQESEQSDLIEHLLSNDELSVIQDILQVLEVAHSAQELLSAELTPTLSLALPIYEVLISSWRTLQTTIPELSRHIGAGISKLEEYVIRARSTRIYAHAMVLNPAIKFSWMKEHWSSHDANQAQAWVEESMLHYQQAFRKENQSSSPLRRSQSETTPAMHRQTAGYHHLLGLNLNIRHSSSMGSLPTPQPNSRSTSPPAVIDTLSEEQALAEDKLAVHYEIERYKAESLYQIHDIKEYTVVNLLKYWEIKEYEFPRLFSVAMDVLPTQASSVPCERIFSSSKETCTLRRNRFRPELLEALQVLKFSFKHNQLTFVDDCIAKEVDYTISGPVTEAARRELKKTGCLKELEELEQNVDDHM